MEIFALVSCASSLDAIHAYGDGIIGRIDHRSVGRVAVSTLVLTSGTVTSEKISAYLKYSIIVQGRFDAGACVIVF